MPLRLFLVDGKVAKMRKSSLFSSQKAYQLNNTLNEKILVS